MTTTQHSLSRKEQVRLHRKRQVWIKRAVVLLGAAALVWLAVVSFGKAGAPNAGPARINAALDNFTQTDATGNKVSLSDYKGQVVLINAWATWCPPCRAEMPALNAYYQAHQSDGFVILAVNAGETSEQAAAFGQENGLAIPLLLDPQNRLLNSLGIQSFPTSILIDRKGVVRTIHIGMMTPEQIEAKVGPLLAE